MLDDRPFANMLHLILVIGVITAACQGAPASWSQWSAPVVRAAPAFEGDLFAPAVGIPARDVDAPLGDNSIQDNGPPIDGGVYSFAYDAQGEDGGHSRQESRDAKGTVTGRYTIALADGRRRTVEYVADEGGFRARVDTNEPGTENRAPADVQWSSTAGQVIPVEQPAIVQIPVAVQPRPPVTGRYPQKRPFVPVDSPRPPTHITARLPAAQPPTGPTVALIPVATPPGITDEPRSPHHPPRGFNPPNPSSRIHLAPPRPINVSWNQPVALGSAPWGSYLNAYPSGIVHLRVPYPVIKKKK